ncbi:MAG: amidohydrolase, partial [Candidatus Obscuribacterales bacterium]
MADIVIKNARVYTMDAARRWQQSVAVKADRIIYVGTDDGASSLIGPGTRVIDASGGMVMPGMFDCHVHLADGGVHLNECNLDDCKTSSAVLKRVKDYASSKPDLEWIRGAGWILTIFQNGNPSKKDLDDIIPDRPVFLESQDYHSGWANSAALARAGITRDTRDPIGGRIERDESGEPTGTLRETAMHIIQKLIPERAHKDYVAGLRRGQELASRLGITSIQDAWVNMELLAAYDDLNRENELRVRVNTAWKIDPDKDFGPQVEGMKELRDRYSRGMVSFSSAKLFADGVIEAHTAALIEPYIGIKDKMESDELNFPGEKMKDIVSLLEKGGFQVHVHAIGDRAVRTTLDAFQ